MYTYHNMIYSEYIFSIFLATLYVCIHIICDYRSLLQKSHVYIHTICIHTYTYGLFYRALLQKRPIITYNMYTYILSHPISLMSQQNHVEECFHMICFIELFFKRDL